MKHLLLIAGLLISLQQLNAQVPTITSFSPDSGPVGTTVNITGNNFSQVPADNIVYFGAVKALVTSATSTSLSVTVPAGATFNPITVQANGLTGYANRPFVVTFSRGCEPFTPLSFGDPRSFGTASGLFNMATGDIDGDGKPDVVLTSSFRRTFSVLKNVSTNGSIVLDINVKFGTGGSPEQIAIGDIDGDGKPDVVVANGEYYSTISIFRNTSTPGNISFDPKIDLATGEDNRSGSVAIGDIDRDGKIDIATTTNLNNSVLIFRNTSFPGAISFKSKIEFATGAGPTKLQLVDLDNDRRLDLGVLCTSDYKVTIYSNNSTPGIISFIPQYDIALDNRSFSFAFGDINHDNKPDLITSSLSRNTVTIYLASQPSFFLAGILTYQWVNNQVT